MQQPPKQAIHLDIFPLLKAFSLCHSHLRVDVDMS